MRQLVFPAIHFEFEIPMRILLQSCVLIACICFSFSELLAQSKTEPTLSNDAISKFSWRDIGPANMGGRITAISVYENDPNIWWAASASGGLLKTTNNGVTFEHQFDDQATVSIGDVQVAPSDSNIVWVGSGEANPRNSASWGDGVYKSTDGGKTWKNMGLKEIFQTGRIAIHPTNPDIVYVGALGRLWGPSPERGLYKTEDGGESWKQILFIDENTGIIDLQMNPQNPDNLIVAAYQRRRDGFDGNDPEVKFGPGAGIYRTTDAGQTFAKISEGLPSVQLGRIGLAIYRQDPNQIYAIIESERIGETPEDFPYVGFNGESVEVGAKILSISDDSAAAKAGLKVDDIVIAVDESRVLDYEDLQKAIRQKKAGDKASWEVRRAGKTVQLELTYDKRESTNEEAGEPSQNQRRSRSPFSASLGGQQANLQGQQGEAEKDYGGVYHSQDNGITWKRINSLNPRPMYYSQIRVDPSDNQRLYVLGTSLHRSDDGGQTFTEDGADASVHVDHHALWIDPNDGRHMILGNDGGIYVTYDRMEHWDHHNHVAICQFYHVGVSANADYKAYGGLQDNGSWGGPTRVADAQGPMNSDWFRVGGGDGFVCLVDPTDPDQIYFESQNGAMGRIHLKTGERGFIRPRAPRGTRYRFNWKTPFILSPHNPDIHYSVGNYVFRSISKGDRVQAISPEITRTDKGSGSAVSESPREPGVIYAGTTDGALWMTKDDGQNWIDLFDAESLKALKSKPTNNTQPDSAPAEGGGERSANRGGVRLPSRIIGMLKSRDSNADGFIEASELPANMQRMLERLDRDGDGKLSMAEIEPPAAQAPNTPQEKTADSESKTGEISPEKPEGQPEENAPQKDPSETEQDAVQQTSKSEQVESDLESQAESESESDAEASASPQQSSAAEASVASNVPTETAKSAKPDPVSGKWTGSLLGMGSESELTLTLKLEPENRVTGFLETSRSNGEVRSGTYAPDSGSLQLVIETDQATLDVQASIEDLSMKGKIDVNQGTFSLEFEANRSGDGTGKADSKDDGSLPIAELVPEPRWVSSLTASRFADGRCYLTLDGHRSNDDEPYLFVTENHGQTWRSIRGNLPTSAGSTRVLREDLENQEVLYLG
ncbi:MAG: PDZ domain-containing protein, partial [bacterium]|nr:PDZ domain-containing protein [bacterium]